MDQPIALPGDPIKIEVLLAQLRAQHYRVARHAQLTDGVPLLLIERAPDKPSAPSTQGAHDDQTR